MATLKDLTDALDAQNAAILVEVEEIKAAILAAGAVIPQELVDRLNANTQEIVDIVNTPLPEPTPAVKH